MTHIICNKQEWRVAWDLESGILFQLDPRSPDNVDIRTQTLVESSGSQWQLIVWPHLRDCREGFLISPPRSAPTSCLDNDWHVVVIAQFLLRLCSGSWHGAGQALHLGRKALVLVARRACSPQLVSLRVVSHCHRLQEEAYFAAGPSLALFRCRADHATFLTGWRRSLELLRGLACCTPPSALPSAPWPPDCRQTRAAILGERAQDALSRKDSGKRACPQTFSNWSCWGACEDRSRRCCLFYSSLHDTVAVNHDADNKHEHTRPKTITNGCSIRSYTCRCCYHH